MSQTNLKGAFTALSLSLLIACSSEEPSQPSVQAPGPTSPEAAAPAAPAKPDLVARMDPAPEWASAAQTDSTLMCYGDLLNDLGGAAEGQHLQVAIGTPLQFSGWAVDKTAPADSEQPPVIFKLSPVEGAAAAYYYPAKRHERPDVTAAPSLASVRPKAAGLMLAASTDGISPGLYQVEYVVGEGADAKLCSPGTPWVLQLTDG